jgi:hypothetical protein
MATTPIGPCAHCGGTKLARLSSVDLQMVMPGRKLVVDLQREPPSFSPDPDVPHRFDLLMCTACGKTDWFSLDPAKLLKKFGEKAEVFDLASGGSPYRG